MTKNIRRHAPEGAEFYTVISYRGDAQIAFRKLGADCESVYEWIDGRWEMLPHADPVHTAESWYNLHGDIAWWLWALYGAAIALAIAKIWSVAA